MRGEKLLFYHVIECIWHSIECDERPKDYQIAALLDDAAGLVCLPAMTELADNVDCSSFVPITSEQQFIR